MVAEGLQEWDQIAALRYTGADVSEYLCFVLCFDAQEASQRDG